MLDELSKDRYGIAFTAMQYGRSVPEIKALALAAQRNMFVQPTKENFRNRTYPLARSVFIYLNQPKRLSIQS
jgi:phosphate transport system substrate-binding protein